MTCYIRIQNRYNMNILLTGGATGLGAAITKRLSTGNVIYFTYSQSKQEAEELVKLLPDVKSIHCDFRVEEDISTLKAQIKELDIDVLINNAYAGSFLASHFHKTAKEDFASAFMQNILPTIEITQTCIEKFRKKKAGKIITVLTAALTNVPPVGSSVYVANKAYLQQLSKIWATENVRYNITSNTISPAFMQTKFTSGMDERLVAQMIENHPLKKLLTTNEVAEAVAFLVDAQTHINGYDMVINSGACIK